MKDQLREDILGTLKLIRHEMEGTNAWDMMSQELRSQIRSGIVRMEASDHLNPSANDSAFRHLDQIMEAEYNRTPWMFRGRIVDTMRELGRRTWVERIEKEQEEERA